jgi:hypothetical protein
MTVKLVLFGDDKELVKAWRAQFGGLPNVQVAEGNVERLRYDALVLPTDTSGMVDKRLHAAACWRFGDDFPSRLQDFLRDLRRIDPGDSYGVLSVGQAQLVPTADEVTPWIIVASTIREASVGVSPDAPYGAMKAALGCATRAGLSPPIRVVAASAMWAGAIPVAIIALQMWIAYKEILLGGVYRGPCYCSTGVDGRQRDKERGIPVGFCALCHVCGQPGHTRHHPGDVPFTGAWCDDHYDELVAKMRASGRLL